MLKLLTLSFRKSIKIPVTSGNLEADFITNRECHVSFHIILSIWQEKALATILVAYAPLLASSQFGSDSSSYALFTQYLVGRLK